MNKRKLLMLVKEIGQQIGRINVQKQRFKDKVGNVYPKLLKFKTLKIDNKSNKLVNEYNNILNVLFAVTEMYSGDNSDSPSIKLEYDELFNDFSNIKELIIENCKSAEEWKGFIQLIDELEVQYIKMQKSVIQVKDILSEIMYIENLDFEQFNTIQSIRDSINQFIYPRYNYILVELEEFKNQIYKNVEV